MATWYLWEDGRVLVNMDHSRARLEHLRHDPRVSLTVLDRRLVPPRQPARAASPRSTPDEELKDIDRISNHYRGQAYPNRDSARFSAWIEIDTLARMERLS